ncbi:MAG TPA: hypothetical protein VH518_10585 [Tepidisphaeraceae bacterium]|jgi:type IV pilus assembly protein PilQ
MKKWTKTAGLIFMAAASVYADRAIAAKPGKPANTKAAPTDVKVLEETDPFATPPASTGSATAAGATGSTQTSVSPLGAPTTEPSTQPSKGGPASPAQLNADGTFSLNITAGADIVEQLRVIGFQAQASIIPSKEVHGALPAMDLYNVTVHEALDALLHTNGFAWREQGKFIYVYSAKEVAEMEKANRVASTEVFRLFYTPAANAVVMIKPVLSGDAQVAITTPAKSGIGTGTADVGGNDHPGDDVIVVSDYPENLDRVRKILKEVDRRPQQILIEATILAANLNEDNTLGVDFNFVGGVDFNSITSAAGQILGADIPNPTGVVGDQVHTVGTGNNFTKGVANAFRVGVVTDNFSVFLAALEGTTDTTVLANPKVLALNKQKGEVIVGNETGYLTTTTTETSSTQTIEFLKTGTRLVFRPFIADDGYIRMEVHPEDSSGGLQTAANLPFKTTTEVTSNVMIKDGHTIVIGGLFRESSSSTKSQVPVLGNIPLVGTLFRNQSDATRRQEIIIMLTPHIIKDDDVMSELAEKAMKDGERLRVGVRRGMMFWGRERLADMFYQTAVDEMAKSHPDRSKALWNLDAAINLCPTMSEAHQLRQELTGKEITTADGSAIRTFVKRAILADHVASTQPSLAEMEAAEAAAEVARAATQPALADAATSQPTNVADAATSQPSEQSTVVTDDVAMAEPTTGTTTQPANVAGATPTEQYEEVAGADKTTVPTTGPSNSKDDKSTTVTELPTEELPAATGDKANDANK